MSRLTIRSLLQRGAPSKARRLLVCAVAMALMVSIAGGGLFHVHKTPEAAAACTACHIGHAPALPIAAANFTLPEPAVVGSVLRIVAPNFISADAALVSSRAPPAVA